MKKEIFTLSKVAFCILIFLSSIVTMHANDTDQEVIRTIILINRQAELVDVNMDGDILERFVAVPDYFSSGRSHRGSLKRSLRKLKMVGAVDYTLPGSSSRPAAELQSYMISETAPDITTEPSIAAKQMSVECSTQTISHSTMVSLSTTCHKVYFTEPKQRIRQKDLAVMIA